MEVAVAAAAAAAASSDMSSQQKVYIAIPAAVAAMQRHISSHCQPSQPSQTISSASQLGLF
jgi:hypothetical protein